MGVTTDQAMVSARHLKGEHDQPHAGCLFCQEEEEKRAWAEAHPTPTPTLADHVASTYAVFKTTRELRRLSLRDVAEQIGTVSFNTLSRFERGHDCRISVLASVLRWMDALPPYSDESAATE
jgi:hypothetical protein